MFFYQALRRDSFWAVVYIILAVGACCHNLATLPSTLPTGKPNFGVVSLFNAWTVWWNADRLRHGLAGYWDAPIFWPEKGAFAFSEPQPLTHLVAPAVWYFEPVVAYHTYFFVSLVLNAVFARRLFYEITLDHAFAGLAGCLVVWTPLVLQQPELLQYVAIWPILWSWAILLRLLERPSLSQGVYLGIALALSFCGSIHLGLFNLVLVLAIWPWFAARSRVGTWTTFLLGLIIGGVCILPLALPMMAIIPKHAEPRSPEVVTFLSAKLFDWIAPADYSLEGRVIQNVASGRPLNPGWARSLLAVLAAVIVWICAKVQGTERRGLRFLSLVALLAVTASLGRNVTIFGGQPWDLLAHLVPPFAQVRSPYRFAYLAQPALLILAVAGLRCLYRWFALSEYFLRGRRLTVLVTILLSLIVCMEVPPPAPYFVPAPDYSDPPGWVNYLARHAKPQDAALLLHFPLDGQLMEYEPILRAMLWQPIHGLPLANGYSGFLPSGWLDLARVWRQSPYSDEAMELLCQTGVRYLIRPPTFPPPPTKQVSGTTLRRVFKDINDYEIWELSCPTSKKSNINP